MKIRSLLVLFGAAALAAISESAAVVEERLQLQSLDQAGEPTMSEGHRAAAATTTDEDTTDSPTSAPTKKSTPSPTEAPTKSPTRVPTLTPTLLPTKAPSTHPTQAPTKAPSKHPTASPTTSPTDAPTTTPLKVCLIYHVCEDCIKANDPNPEEHTQGFCDWGYDTLVGKHVCFQTAKAVTASTSDICVDDSSDSTSVYLSLLVLLGFCFGVYRRLHPSSSAPLSSLVDGDGNPRRGAGEASEDLERGQFERTPLTAEGGSASRADDWDWDEGGGGGGGGGGSDFDGRSQVDVEMTRLERHRQEEEDLARSARDRDRERDAQDRASKKAAVTTLTAGKVRPPPSGVGSAPLVPVAPLGLPSRPAGASGGGGAATPPASFGSSPSAAAAGDGNRGALSPAALPTLPQQGPKASAASKMAADPDDIFASFGIAAKPKFGVVAPTNPAEPSGMATTTTTTKSAAGATATETKAPSAANDGWQKDDLDDLLDFN